MLVIERPKTERTYIQSYILYDVLETRHIFIHNLPIIDNLLSPGPQAILYGPSKFRLHERQARLRRCSEFESGRVRRRGFGAGERVRSVGARDDGELDVGFVEGLKRGEDGVRVGVELRRAGQLYVLGAFRDRRRRSGSAAVFLSSRCQECLLL